MISKFIVSGILLLSLLLPIQNNQNIRESHAAPITFDFGKISLVVPLTTVNAVYLYDLVDTRSLFGGETTIFMNSYGIKVNLTAGAVADLDANGVPFIGIDFPLPESFFGQRLSFGGFVGYDFNADTETGEKEQLAGIKANMLLW